jgi:hypothetical protein
MVIAKPVKGEEMRLSTSTDLCKEVSTKSNDNTGVAHRAERFEG